MEGFSSGGRTNLFCTWEWCMLHLEVAVIFVNILKTAQLCSLTQKIDGMGIRS
jgi:hypothetical protein